MSKIQLLGKRSRKIKPLKRGDLLCEKEGENIKPLKHDNEKESMGKDISGNTENSICYVDDGKTINLCQTEVNDIFIYHVAIDIEMNTNNDPELRSMTKK